MPLRILAQSAFDTATASIGFGSAVAGYPASNALTARRSEFARATTAFSAGVLYYANFSFVRTGTRPVNCIAMARTNVASNGFFSADVRASGSVLLSTGTAAPLVGNGALDTLIDDSSRSVNNHVFWLGSTYNADEATAQLITSNAAGVVEVARVMAGVYKQLDLNFDWDWSVNWDDPSSAERTYGGDLITSYGGPRTRTLTLPFSRIPEADRAYLFDLARVIGPESDLFISLWPGSGGRLERDHQMWCRLKIVGDIKNSTYGRYGTSAVFTEC